MGVGCFGVFGLVTEPMAWATHRISSFARVRNRPLPQGELAAELRPIETWGRAEGNRDSNKCEFIKFGSNSSYIAEFARKLTKKRQNERS
jgi:hypothetical protein